MKKILIIEDEKEIRNILRVYLNTCGYEVEEAEDGEEGINLFYAKTFDLVLLDVMLPKKDGWSICREIKQYSSVPVIIMTARTDENDEVFGLELGADDYITKPFSNKVLVARIKTILKNRENRKEDILKVGNIEINDISHTVNVNGRKVELAPKEYEILMYMIKNSNIALRREKMLVEIWGYDFDGSDRIIDVHIKNLRKKIGEEYIKTVRNIGYKFEID
ncbi:MAG: response regulator transcription factor [Fusobacterium sp.]|uniref:response regulator transcription factor n=1 Tax=Fusobacterium sp. TaxID=68766 RepID=UPI002A753062|nr:response regulator transcription factor [Fusobacterium sp.]MDY3058845.1 response regulator transcription factor [Fusobacterium sp.]